MAMRGRRVLLIIVLVLAVLGVFAALLPSNLTIKTPPIVTFVRQEPAGIEDDTGEMSLVTLHLKDPNTALQPEDRLCIRDSAEAVEIKVSDRWVKLGKKLDWHGIRRGEAQRELLVPAGASACRVTLEYTDTMRVFTKHPVKGRVLWVAEHLPGSVRHRFSGGFWRWAGFPEYGPSPGWRQVSFELLFTAPTNAPAP